MNLCQNKPRKDLKKINKIRLRLTDTKKIKFCSEATLTIIVANAGLGNAVKRHELEIALSSVAEHILDIVTPPKESFAIILCKDKQSSSIIKEQMEEFIISTLDLVKRPFVNAYCLYAEEVSEDVLNSVGCFNTTLPDGLEVVNDFINESDERDLVEYFLELNTDKINQMKKRSVLHFGYEFNYSKNNVDTTTPLCDRPIPDNCKSLLKLLAQQTGRSYSLFDQLTVNMYRPGDGIPPHVDTHSAFSDEIISVSLGSDIIMEFTNPETSVCTSVDLPARSVCIMRGESRYLWLHSIAARKSDLIINKDRNNLTRRQRCFRVSLTFRKVNPTPHCNCKWPQKCNIAQNNEETNHVSLENPAKLEGEFVHKVYDEIADHFSSTRHSMWPNVKKFIAEQNLGSIGADIGCGNGKYFPAISERGLVLGSDMSVNLCKIASRAHNVDVVQSNCLQLPYRHGCCDFFISIAVVHHLSTDVRRREAVGKMANLLCSGGKGLIYVWAKEQKKTGVRSHYVSTKNNDARTPGTPITTAPETLLPVHTNRTEFACTDMLVPWSKKGDNNASQVYTRYYHLFVDGELEALCRSVEGVSVLQSWYDSGNWAVVIEKL